MELMGRTLDGRGHLALGSPTQIRYYDRRGGLGPPAHLAVTEMTGGALGRGTSLPPGPVVTASPDIGALVAAFRSQFPDGIVFDAETAAGSADMRALDQTVLARVLPVALAAPADGNYVVDAAGRWITPVFDVGTLRLVLVLPDAPDPDGLRAWRRRVRRRD
jgi:hypothetical protein